MFTNLFNLQLPTARYGSHKYTTSGFLLGNSVYYITLLQVIFTYPFLLNSHKLLITIYSSATINYGQVEEFIIQ